MTYNYKERREKIISIFKSNELTIYHAEDIAELVGASVSSVRNDLMHLLIDHKELLKVHRLKIGTSRTSYTWYSSGNNKRGHMRPADDGLYYVSKPNIKARSVLYVWLKVKERTDQNDF